MEGKHPEHDNSASRALIYMHIPKCGGTTVTSILTKAVSGASHFMVDGGDVAESRNRLASLPETERMRVRLLSGHLSFGWHELLRPARAQYITLLRDPISRVVSHYNHVCEHEDHYLHAAVMGKRMTIGDYVESGITCEVNNGQVRQISGIEDIIQIPYGPSRLAYGMDHSGALTQAFNNIQDHFLMVGLLERFDESMDALKRLTGIPIGAYRARNQGNPNRAVYRPTEAEIDVIRHYNRQDCELYAACTRRFEVAAQRLRQTRRMKWPLLTRRN